jgi:alcohol dehydrogenase class IV
VVAHSRGGQPHIPYGLTNAVLLPYVLESYGETVYNKCRDLGFAMGIQKPACHADKEANPLYPVPRLMNAKELERFYYDVMEDGQ